MTRTRKQRWLVGLLAVVALATVAWFVGSRLVESWHIERLNSGDDDEQYASAMALARRRSRRGLDAMVRQLREDASKVHVDLGEPLADDMREQLDFVLAATLDFGADGPRMWHREAFALYARLGAQRLDRLLDDDNPFVQFYAIDALRHVGADAVPPLLDRFTGGDQDSGLRAGRALSYFESEPVKPHAARVARVLDRAQDWRRRVFAARILAGLGRDAALWIAPLRSALDDSRAEVVAEAATALGAIGPDAAPALDSLVQLSADAARTEPARLRAIEALGRIESDAALTVLRELARSSDGSISSVARDAIERIEGDFD